MGLEAGAKEPLLHLDRLRDGKLYALVDGPLAVANSNGCIRGYLACELACRIHELVRGIDGIHETNAQRLVCLDVRGGVDELLGHPDTHQAGEPLRATEARGNAKSDFGLTDFTLELSTRDEGAGRDKFIGSDADWAAATSVLERACASSGLEVVPDPGGAAFYGPKVSVQVKDAIGRTWQMSTIQYDFNQPERFGLEYTAPDGSHRRPVMIHSAKLGSVERFIGVLTEHYAGAFPAWLSPVQVVGIPVAGEFNDYLAGVAARLRARGVRVEIDDSDDRMQKKIRNATRQKAPFMLIAGQTDRAAGAVSFRFRDGSQFNGVPVDEAVERIVSHIASRANEDPTAAEQAGTGE